jgi:hypothetical protein
MVASAETDNIDLGIIKEIVQQALDDLVQAHQHEMFLVKSRSRTSRTAGTREDAEAGTSAAGSKRTATTRATLDSLESEDSATAAFKSSFPSLSRSPSPERGQILPGLTASEEPDPEREQDPDQFEGRTHRMVDTLCYELQQHIEQAVQAGSQGWKREKEQGMQEFQELEKELATAESQIQALNAQLTEQSRLHNLVSNEMFERLPLDEASRILCLLTPENNAHRITGFGGSVHFC